MAATFDPALDDLLRRTDPDGTGPDGPLFGPDALRALQAVPQAQDKLVAVMRNPAAADAVRFAAAIGLIEGGWTAWLGDPSTRDAAAGALVTAMRNDKLHNRWGLPQAFVGPFGRQLVALGACARTRLSEALGDRRPLTIMGSEAATIQAQKGYTVSDLAAWLTEHASDSG